MTTRVKTREDRFIEVGWGFHGVLLGSRMFWALMWMMLEKVLGVGAVRRWFYLATKPSHVGVDVNGLACLLHCSMTCNRQTR
jgi:hypothetical protein